jgi:prophage maintenance system killer protein
VRYLTLSEALELHRRIIGQSGGALEQTNKRTGHAAMEIFLLLNNFEIQSSVDEQERIVLQVASGEMDREAFTVWLRDHVVPKS